MDPQPLLPLHFEMPLLTNLHQVTFKENRLFDIRSIDTTAYIISTQKADGCAFSHVDQGGVLLASLQHPIRNLREWLIVSQQEVAILESHLGSCYISLWNVKNSNYHKLKINLVEKSSENGIFYFRNSHMICFYSKSQNQLIQVAYYKVLQFNLGKPHHQYVTNEFLYINKFSRERLLETRTIKRLNDDSMIGILRQKFVLDEEKYQFVFYGLDLTNSVGSLKRFQLNKVVQMLNPEKLDLMIAVLTDVWQVKSNLFYLQFFNFVENQSFKINHIPGYKTLVERYHSLQFDAQKNKVTFSFFDNPELHRLQFINRPRELKYYEKKTILGHSIQGKQITLVPIFCIEPNNSFLLPSPLKIKNVWRQKYEWINYQPEHMFKISYKNNTVYKKQSKQFTNQWYPYINNLEMEIVSWLCQIIEDCDDDLVYFVCNLL